MSSSLAPPASRPPATNNQKSNRLPVPTLFVGPPSRTPSQLSLTRTTTDPAFKATRGELGNSGLSQNAQNSDPTSSSDPNALPRPTLPTRSALESSFRSTQNTLNEVELTAQTTTHVFGAAHAAALDSLHDAQVALARAWGRGNEDQSASGVAKAAAAQNLDSAPEIEADRFRGAEEIAAERGRTATGQRARGSTQGSASTNLTDESGLSEGEEGSSRSRLGSMGKAESMEDETAMDIRRASERRAANEAYFRQVDRNVKDVVEKLEKVAEAMRGVEAETRSLWSQESSSRDGAAEDGSDGDATASG